MEPFDDHCGSITNVEAVMAQLYRTRPHVTETELNFYAAAAVERESLKTLMLLLEEGRLDVRLRPGGNFVLINDYEWKVRDLGDCTPEMMREAADLAKFDPVTDTGESFGHKD